MNALEIQLIHFRDQAWADIAQYKDDLARMSDNGPQDERDVDIVRKCMHIMVAEVSYRSCNNI